ncbi:MAG TPA: IS110 family transposase [Planctomycetaceae bacterium]|nr:IS110 family transposase [Planctomycetaceae bacterium]
MDYAKIVALDLGKFKTVACVMLTADQSHRFETIAMSPQAVHDLLARHAAAAPAQTLVVMETCDCCGWVHDLCTALGLAVMVISAHDERWRWKRVKRKTDRDDALKLARLALLDQLTAVHVPEPRQRQRRRLILHRRSVVSRRTQSRNAIRSIFSQQGIGLAKGGKQWTLAGLALLRGHARPLSECDDELDLWRGRLHVELELMAAVDAQLKQLDQKLDALGKEDDRIQLCQTIKGVGPRVAEAVVSHLGDVDRFKSARQVAGYAGLVPKQIESGQMSRFGHITGRGPSLLRSMLVEAAWVVWRHNDWARAWGPGSVGEARDDARSAWWRWLGSC